MTQPARDVQVVVIGAGVVGCAVALALVRRGVSVVLLEAEPAPALGASGTNSGILHTGFDSVPGELETELILASGRARSAMLEALQIPVLRAGALMHGDAAVLSAVAANAATNGVSVIDHGGVLEIPGEAITDPVAYTLALAGGAAALGAELRMESEVVAFEGRAVRTAGGESVSCSVIVNCAGLYADSVAGLAGDDSFSIYPRKGEFLVFEPPGPDPLERILLPVPTKRTKGVLVFPTIDGKVVAGPTAVDLEDKRDWSVRPQSEEEIVAQACAIYPALEDARPIAAYAGLRPAGRGVNYLIGRSVARPELINVAAIRSTGLTASVGIAQHVVGLVAATGVQLKPEHELQPGPPPAAGEPWWRRTASHWAAA